jgi:hypothetical protein
LAAADAEPAEIGWQEVDSIEELEGLGSGEGFGAEPGFEFEEADAATLAELGLSSQPAGASATDGTHKPDVSAPAEEKGDGPAVTRKPRTRKPSTRSAAKPAAEPTATTDAKPRARSTGKAASKEAGTGSRASASTTAAKPRASRTTRGKASPAPADASDEEGIWKRFTSGRSTRKRTTPKPPTEG